jgi:tRNA threonylcarbamoyladenosine biosynthesis protein TsaB
MNILALDTSTSLASAAITSSEAVIAESTFTCNRSLSARLVPEIEHLLGLAGLAISDIDLFAASTGPGSFTGVRCGVATVQGLALATGKPCAGFSSLAMLSMNFSLATHPVCSLLDARKNEVYAGLYDCSGRTPSPLIRDCVMPMEQFLSLISATTDRPVIFLGEGAQRYHEIIQACMSEQALFATVSQNTGRAAHGAVLALDTFLSGNALDPAQLLPDYIRASEAEIARLARMNPAKHNQ